MVEMPEQGGQLNLDQRINHLLRKSPLEADFGWSYIEHATECIGLATDRYRERLVAQFPQLGDDINKRLRYISAAALRHLPESGFRVEEGRPALAVPNRDNRDMTMFLNRIGEAVYHANQAMGLFEYLIATYPTKDPKYIAQRHPWFNNRLTRIMEVGSLTPNSAPIEYIGVGYATQIGKIAALDRSVDLLKRASTFSGLDSPERVEPYLNGIQVTVSKLKVDQSYIATGLHTMKDIAERSGWSEEHTQLLLDLAFIRNKAFDLPVEFSQALLPIIKLMSVGDWAAAYEHRDFLLRFFSSSFPAWRRSRYASETGIQTFESYKDLAGAIVKHKVAIDGSEVPDEYQPFFSNVLSKKVDRAEHRLHEVILEESIPLSNAFVRELGKTTAKLVSNRYPYYYYHKENPFSDNQWEQIRRAQAEGLPLLNIPTPRAVYIVEHQAGNQIYWYPTDHLVKVKIKDGQTDMRMKSHYNFSTLVRDLVLTAPRSDGKRPVLGSEDIIDCLERAFVENKEGYHFTQKEYLEALVSSLPSPLGEEEAKIVGNFIQDLDS